MCVHGFYHSFPPGCTSEPGYYAATAEDSLPGYAGISIGPNAGPEDCAIGCPLKHKMSKIELLMGDILCLYVGDPHLHF